MNTTSQTIANAWKDAERAPRSAPDTLVVGGGVIGLSAALELQRRGHLVLVLERAPEVQGASRGNAGAFAFADIEPLATPGIMRRAPRWLLDPLGPLSIRPGYSLRIAPWLLRFWRASWRDRHAAAVAAQAALMGLSAAAMERLVADLEAEPLLRRQGQLQLYDTKASFEASQPGWARRKAHGVRFELLQDARAIAAIQPGLSPKFRFAGYTPDWTNVTDPAAWHDHLLRCFTARGGKLMRGDLLSISVGSDGKVTAQTSGGAVSAGHLVLAAGAWSHRITRGWGEPLPLETERGYTMTLPNPNVTLSTHLTFQDHGFVATSSGSGIRVGGAVELGGLELAPNLRRAQVMLRKAQGFLPGLNGLGGVPWMGFRPSMPDSLPVIAPARLSNRVVMAFGHGHLGLTQSAGTAELVADLIEGRASAIDLSPYAASRFGSFFQRLTGRS